ncbi:SWI/SNF chromatin-remodeling complex subunit [Malassezia yamatoensis]|uniref:SWI/SNF chromatin-remodeling complex subunit n=1 Tax=Malassezia yamatoensis TaxID=253288 RepID=A0AAJ6CIX5_9BASI|nr:SWI/SNF chromatin-remodeling complex subunit [Malassezia yamatoensis]
MYGGAPASDVGGASNDRSDEDARDHVRASAGIQQGPGDKPLGSQGIPTPWPQGNASHQRDTVAPSSTQIPTSQPGWPPGSHSGTPTLQASYKNPGSMSATPLNDKLETTPKYLANAPNQSTSSYLPGSAHPGTSGASVVPPSATGPRRGRPPRNPRPPQPTQPATMPNVATHEMSGIPHGPGANPYIRRPPMNSMQFSPALNAQQQKALMARAVQMSKAHNQPSYTPLHALFQMGFMYVRNSQLPNMPPQAAQGGTILRADEAAALGLLNNPLNTTPGSVPHPQPPNAPSSGSNMPWQSTSIPSYARPMPPNTQRQGVNSALATVPPSNMMLGPSKLNSPQNGMDGISNIAQVSDSSAPTSNFASSSFAPGNRTDIPFVHGGAPPASSSVGMPVTLQNTRLSKIGTDSKPNWDPLKSSQTQELEQIMRKDAEFTPIWQAQQKYINEELVACVAPVLHPARPGVSPRPVAWWEKTMQEPAAPMRNPNYEPFRLILPAQRQRSLEQSGRRSRASVPLTGTEVEKAINAPEVLVPIRLELDHEPFKLRDTFLWNAAEETNSLEAFAVAICEDMGLPTSVFVPLIRTSVQTQVQEYATAMALRPEPTTISMQAATQTGRGTLSEDCSENWGNLRNRILNEVTEDNDAPLDEQTAPTKTDSRLDHSQPSAECRDSLDAIAPSERTSAEVYDASKAAPIPLLETNETDSTRSTQDTKLLASDSNDEPASETFESSANEPKPTKIDRGNSVSENLPNVIQLLPGNENEMKSAAVDESWRSVTQADSLDVGSRASEGPLLNPPPVESSTKQESEPIAVTSASIETSGELRVLIKLDILVGAQNLVDQFEWDLLNHDEVVVDRFAEKFAADLGLSGEFMTAIAHSIHEQVSTHLRLLYLLGYPYNRLGSMDEEIRTAFLAELNAHHWVRERHDVDAYTPKLLQLTASDALFQEREHERDMRRKRRQTKGRRGVNLAEREPQRTIRSAPVYGLQGGVPESHDHTTYYPTRRAAAAAASANLATSVEDSQEESGNLPAKRVRTDRLEMQFRYPGGLGHYSAPTQPRFRSSALTQIPLDVLGRRTSEATPNSQPDLAIHARGRPPKERASVMEVTTSRGIRPEDLERQHPNMHEGVWHCGNCGVPGYLAPGRRKGPAGEKTLCGPCGKYYHRHRRMDNVRYTRDPAYHSKRLKQNPNPTFAENDEISWSDRDDLPTEAMDIVQKPDHYDSASQLDRTLENSETDEGHDSSDARPPAWLVSAADALRLKYPNDTFQIQLRPPTAEIPAQVGNEWRIRCADCPGKVYKPGPSESLINFEIHLKNRSHRAAVSRRIGHIP